MEAVWRKDSDAIVEARQKNTKYKFFCVSCGADTEAPADSQRFAAKSCKNCFGKKKDVRKNLLNNLSGAEWASLSKSVEQYNGTRSDKQRIHGAAFPQSLAESHISTYSKIDDLVFDPFMGVGTTCDAAQSLGRRSFGIELNPEFAELAKNDVNDHDRHTIICDDVRNIQHHLKPSSVDLILTSPPYATLLKTVKGNFAYKWREHSELSVLANPLPYSRHDNDLGNLSYSEFMDVISGVFGDCFSVLKPNSYAVWVVKDYRDLKGGMPYVNFHGDVIRAAEVAGFQLWDIRIYDQTKFRPLVVLGYPSRNYYLNIGHSYILIFKKPEIKVNKHETSRDKHPIKAG